MLGTIHVEHGTRKKVTSIGLLVLLAAAYWPLGVVLEGTLSPVTYLLWIVIGIPAVQVLIFGINAYANVQEDGQLGEDESNLDLGTTKADDEGDP